MIPLVQEVTARGLPPEVWRPLLSRASALRTPPFRTVTVVVPHPDDETLGCGGLLHRMGRTGDVRVTVVFVSDGAAGYPSCSAAQAEALVGLRRAEARAALRALGHADATVVFLDVPDGRIGLVETELAQKLATFVAPSATPDDSLCLAPWPHDPHPDHQAVGRAALAATGQTGIELWQYPIWMRHSIRPNDAIVDVERLRVLRLSPAEQAIKRCAIATHASQVRAPFPGYGPVLPPHVLELFDDGLEPFFLAASDRTLS